MNNQERIYVHNLAKKKNNNSELDMWETVFNNFNGGLLINNFLKASNRQKIG